MAQPQPVITYSNLLTGTDITKYTIQLYLQISIGTGYYTVGGIAAGLQAYASQQGISANAQFLFSQIASELQTLNSNLSLPTEGGFTYKYIPAKDLLQIFDKTGLELTASEPIPQGVYTDTIVGVFTWNRL